MSEKSKLSVEFQKNKPQNSEMTPERLANLMKKREEALKRKAQFIQSHKTSNSVPSSERKLNQVKLNFEQSDQDIVEEERKNTVSIELFTKDELLMKTSVFASKNLRTAIITSGGEFNKEQSGWVISINKYQEFRDKARLIDKLTFKELPEFVTKGLLSPKIAFCKKCPHKYELESERTIESLGEDFISKLYPFQKEGVKFALERYGRALIGDEMGVGKTIQGVSIAACYEDEWPVLVICPASVKLNWRDEFLKWVPNLTPKDFNVIQNSKNCKSNAKIWIISYTLATNIESLLVEKSFNVIIADESHYLKNFNAKRTKFLVPFIQKAKRAILLSGTPVLSRPAELFTQLSCIRPDIFPSFRAFAERYCDPKIIFKRMDYSGASHMRELHVLISNTIMIRRLKSDVLSQLPEKIRQKVEIPVVHEHCQKIKKSFYDMKKKAKEPSELGEEKTEGDLFLTKAYNLTARAKMKGVCEYVSYLIQSECKFIIFGHHMEMLDAIQDQVEKEKTGYIRIDGSTNMEQRHKGVNTFQNVKDCRVAILGILSAGQGITLTAASIVVMAEMVWTPGFMIQAEDRAHRLGQQKVVNIHYLFGPGTLDEYIWPKIHSKLTVIVSALDGNENEALEDLMNPTCKVGMGDFELDSDFEFSNDPLFNLDSGEKRSHDSDFEEENETKTLKLSN
ncbi:unnamed protein product [Blepharisma stoltei]|uniref:SWI/SNF-related matrix-associated actin-dependent regulator of chromatin subfamily A-like protein 1 n=1 Tax=Blepharisma stoltei TaxID=1481888 RepID=A0AAU9JS21_9CILI|nr:unnamed protein product [Blepharisma stoltei]